MTQNATIEIQARPIKILEATGAHHLFIIYKDSQGQKTILRGGPERDGLIPMGIDDIRIIRAPYVQEYEHLFPNDYFSNDHKGNPSSTIFSGTDTQVGLYIDKMWVKAEEINSQGFDYKLPTPFCKADVCHVQNSNTVIRALVEYADLEFKLPQIDGKDVWVPGVDGEFKHTSIDDVMHKIWAFNTSMLTTSIDRSMQEISAWMTESLKRVDPLVLIFGEVENSMISINSGVMFDIDGDGKKDRTGWLTPKNGFLILDKNQNGVVDGISELFGDENISGFVELAKYDENKDNVIDSKDSIWSKIKLWRDLNTDGISDIRVLSFLTINYGFALA